MVIVCSYKVHNPVFEQEISEELTVFNISSRDYGRVVGKGCGRSTELLEKYDGLKIEVTELLSLRCSVRFFRARKKPFHFISGLKLWPVQCTASTEDNAEVQ